jgi:hypothetical protein
MIPRQVDGLQVMEWIGDIAPFEMGWQEKSKVRMQHREKLFRLCP